MLSKNTTTYLVNRFFEDCFAFWVNEGKDDREAFEQALKEAAAINHNPFVPSGELLDKDAQAEFIAKMKKELR